jgi:hypothetical protein
MKIRLMLLLLLCGCLLLPASSFGQGLPNNPPPTRVNPTPTPAPEPIVPPDGFIPNIQTQELQRAIILGNPPQRPRSFTFRLPEWFKRPPEIPESYPGRRNDGEVFLP